MVRGSLSHVDLTVTDMSRSVRFYDQVLGKLGYKRLLEAGAGAPCWGVADAAGSVFSIALQRAKPESAAKPHDRYAPGLHHLAFHADSRTDVEGFYKFLQEIEVHILDTPAEYDYTPGYYAVFFADPDGLKLEVVHEPALRGRAG
jgi:catechol 2,3-dioxygenase-like lactoylglutathione lyase family enzyme